MIKHYATVDWDEDAKAYVSGRYKINDKIYINFPTVRQIMFDYGEKTYWQVVFSLVATSSDLIAQLDKKGLDWEQVPDFDIFVMNFLNMTNSQIHILLPTINKEDFIICENSENGEIILYNQKENIIIDRAIQENIADYIRYAHGLKKNVIRAGNAYTKADLIEEAHAEIKRRKLRPKVQKSQMKAYISYIANSYGCLPDDVLEMNINYFFDCVKRINAINEATTLPFMIYYGMVDGNKKETQKRLNPMREDV